MGTSWYINILLPATWLVKALLKNRDNLLPTVTGAGTHPLQYTASSHQCQ